MLLRLLLLLLLLLRGCGLLAGVLWDIGMGLRNLGRIVLRSLLLLLLLGLGWGLRVGLHLVGLGLALLRRLGLLWHLRLVLGRGLDPPALLVVLLWLRLDVSILVDLTLKSCRKCAHSV